MSEIEFKREEFAGYVKMAKSKFVKLLNDNGYEYEDGGLLQSEGWFLDEGHHYIHVECYEEDGETYMYAHRDTKRAGWFSAIVFNHPSNGPRGVNKLRTMLNREGVQYYDDPSIR